MDTTAQIKTLQATYAAQMADSVKRLGDAGALEAATAQKRAEQLATGAGRAAQMGIGEPREVFTRLAELFGCADWTVEEAADGFAATASHCLVCALAKRMGAPSPCRIGCLDPMEGMICGLVPGARFEVEQTLFGGDRCRVEVVGLPVR
jgi:hypothetical protein